MSLCERVVSKPLQLDSTKAGVRGGVDGALQLATHLKNCGQGQDTQKADRRGEGRVIRSARKRIELYLSFVVFLIFLHFACRALVILHRHNNCVSPPVPRFQFNLGV